MFEILRTRTQGKAVYFDFVDESTGMEYKGWRLVRNKNGNYFVASRGEKADGRTHDDVRVAQYGTNPKGRAWIKAVTDAALESWMASATGPDVAKAAMSGHEWAVKRFKRIDDPSRWTQSDWDAHHEKSAATEEPLPWDDGYDAAQEKK